MGELTLIAKILYGTLFGIVSVLSWFVKKELKSYKDRDDELKEDVKEINKNYTDLKDKYAECDKEVALLKEKKIGRPELKEEMRLIEDSFDSKLNTFKKDIKDDINSFKVDIKDDIKEIKDILLNKKV